LLAGLPANDFRRLAPHLKTVPIHTKQVLCAGGEPLRHVYFPNGGVVSITTALSDGTIMEVATVGDEGMVGLEAFLSADALAPGNAMMQVPDTNALSHEFLAVMLGVRRPTVSTVAAALQKAGLIRYTYGRVTVRNRKGLEKASCECYAIIRDQFDRLRQ
jgi:CRP-like cAMP-binding protein